MTAASLWVFLEHEGEELDSAVQELCSEGRRLATRLGQELWAPLLGKVAADVPSELGRFGVDRVLVAQGERLSPPTAEVYADLLAQLVGRYEPAILLLAASSLGRDLAPRLATRLQVGCVPECVRVTLDGEQRLQLTRPVCGDQAYATFVCPDSRPLIATLRLGAFPIQALDRPAPPVVESVEFGAGVSQPRTSVLAQETADPRKMDLAEAGVIVAAGRGVQQAGGYDAVLRLADLLEAPLAGTRPLVDLRLIPADRQVGQSGETVAPKLYIACGISGAPQHTVGMRDSQLIVAIDKRRDAPIFGLADLRVVGDLGPIVSALNERLEGP